MDFTNNLERAMECLHKGGAFLTCKNEDKLNTMTISWGSIGFIWKKPVFTVMVRESRYTRELIEKSGEFTVTIPLNDAMKEALAICGSKSGRDIDKFKQCNLQTEEGKSVFTPVIKCLGMQYECKILYKNHIDANLMDKNTDKEIYNGENYHTIYYGEIVNCYKAE